MRTHVTGSVKAYVIRPEIAQQEADERLLQAWQCIRDLPTDSSINRSKLRRVSLPTGKCCPWHRKA